MIGYPYEITIDIKHKPVTEGGEPVVETKTFTEGGFFTLKGDGLPEEGVWDYFKHYQANSDVKIKEAKALYDMDIAILKLETIVQDGEEGYKQDLVYESSSYCTLLTGILDKTETCWIGTNALWEIKQSKPLETGVVYVSQNDVKGNGLVDSSNWNIYGILIIGDHLWGVENQIFNEWTQRGVDNIKKFIENGGSVIVSGKSGYLLEKWGILAAGTYIPNKILTSITADNNSPVNKAEGITDYDEVLWQSNAQIRNSIVSTYLMNDIPSNNLKTLFSYSYESWTLKVKDGMTGIESDVPKENQNFLPVLLFKRHGKGKIMIHNSNPLINDWFINSIYNSLFVALSKNVVFNSFINFGENNNLPIPGGEEGVKLSGQVDFLNLFKTQITDYELYVWIPEKVIFDFDSLPNCVKKTGSVNFVTWPDTIDKSHYLYCKVNTINQFEKSSYLIPWEITNASVTQQQLEIIMLYPVAYFVDSSTGIKSFLDNQGVKVSAKLSAILRGAINPDPSATYPFPGKGYPADTIIQVENKENTIAYDSVYYAVLPLIAPLADGIDQSSVAYSIEFYLDYYLQHKDKLDSSKKDIMYNVPFKNNSLQNEYIDYKELSGHGVFLAAEWDQPVKISKEPRRTIFDPEIYPDYPETTILDMVNGNHSTIIDSLDIVMQQIEFASADKFYEQAHQRIMPYINTHTKEGAAFFYKDGMSDDIADPYNKDIARRLPIFTRNDIYFYDALGDYQMPKNIDHRHIISIDKFPKPEVKCSNFGEAPYNIANFGYFDHNRPGGLKPNEWSNMLFKICDHIHLDPLKQNITEVSEDIKLIHYLVPIIDQEIKHPTSLVGFVQDGDDNHYGHNVEYDILKFIYAHRLDLKVKPEYSRHGGRLIISLPNDVNFVDSLDPIVNDLVTYSADQVAFYKTTYDSSTKTITAYFKRGLMPNESYGKDSSIGIYIEKLNKQTTLTMTVTLEEVKYDLSKKEQNYESFKVSHVYPNQSFIYAPFYSLPAVEISNHMDRGEEHSSEIKEYELLMPYTRYGVFQQELIAHRTVYGWLETHNVEEPGIVTSSSDLSTLSCIGISTIPFSEYVTHGTGLLIPGCSRTSRLEWRDIWGRHWSQPLRSVFPDIPPIPPPVRNFVISTTYELYDSKGTKRWLDWPSDEQVWIHYEFKFNNNYPKHFLSTICEENKFTYWKYDIDTLKNERIFTNEPDCDYITNQISLDATNYLLKQGYGANYGKCFNTTGAILSGEELKTEDFEKWNNAVLCSSTADNEQMKECLDGLEEVKTMTKRTKETSNTWNYSPRVEDFHPKGFIKGNMWDLTHYDYEDNPMDKAYKYHCDNNLPSLDVSPLQNPAYLKPHNVAAFPLFKGFGYNMTYDKSYTIPKFEKLGYSGWWSDNLQNKDHTLLAGQEISNDISVGKEPLWKDSDWISAKDFVRQNKTEEIITKRLKNIYVCLFNQHRVRVKPSQKAYAYIDNVYQNNVIPIILDLEENDSRLTDYNCPSDFVQYTPKNIKDVDNRVQTATDRDWLYFGVNLRGGARENIHIIMKLEPIEGAYYEGITKVQDGGRFVYWNPVNGPNSFLMVDNPVNTVEASRVDLSLDALLFPSQITTFLAQMYQIFIIEDKNEELREYTMSSYMNSYGFGDSAISVYVGGTKNTKALVKPGEETYVKITFYNNSGFNWNMKKNSINFDPIKEQALNGNDLLYGWVHTIQKP
ncbi:MAG: hypothetical protein ACRC42_02080, partial [Mycoplasma sp.]